MVDGIAGAAAESAFAARGDCASLDSGSGEDSPAVADLAVSALPATARPADGAAAVAAALGAVYASARGFEPETDNGEFRPLSSGVAGSRSQ